MSQPIECAGHPRDMGLAQGRALCDSVRAEVVRAGLPSRRSRWPGLRAVVSGPLRGRGAGRELFRHFAHQAERLEGLAQGADLPLDSLLELQLRTRSGIGRARGSGTDSAGWVVRESRPVVGFRSLELTRPWLVPAVAGVNEAGLAVIAQWPGAALGDGASATAAHHAGAAPPLLLVQDCLARFENVAGALDWCRKRPVEGLQTLLLADASGARAGVEIRGRERRVELGTDALAAQSGRLGELVGTLARGDGAPATGDGVLVRIDPSARRLSLQLDGAPDPEAAEGFGFRPLELDHRQAE